METLKNITFLHERQSVKKNVMGKNHQFMNFEVRIPLHTWNSIELRKRRKKKESEECKKEYLKCLYFLLTTLIKN